MSILDEITRLLSGKDPSMYRNIRITRDETSRYRQLYEFIEHADRNNIYFEGESPIAVNPKKIVTSSYTNIYALDSSSRVVDSPYFFIGVGAVSVINRFTGFCLDIPSADELFEPFPREGLEKFLLIIPEIEAGRELISYISKIAYVEGPRGKPYAPTYNKFAALDEFRIRMENSILQKIIDKRLENIILFVDGPIYYVPPMNKEYGETRGKEEYLDAWRILTHKRIGLLTEIIRKNNIVIGVVKRLHRTNILSKIDPFNLGVGKISDEVYLSIITRKFYASTPQPFYLGPLKYSAGRLNTGLRLPDKTMFYIGIPKRNIYLYSGYRGYAFYRVEVLNDNLRSSNVLDQVLTPVMYDSIITGTLLPLSILLVDQRVKKLSQGITNYLIRQVASRGETTLRYILPT